MPVTIIDLATAQDWVNEWRTKPPKPLAKGHLITGASLQQLLNTNDVVSVRAYMGVDENGEQKLCFVGVDADGNDLIDENEGYNIYASETSCPNICDINSPLY